MRLVRSDTRRGINIDITPVEKPEEVYWVDPTHPHRTALSIQSRASGRPSCPAIEDGF